MQCTHAIQCSCQLQGETRTVLFRTRNMIFLLICRRNCPCQPEGGKDSIPLKTCNMTALSICTREGSFWPQTGKTLSIERLSPKQYRQGRRRLPMTRSWQTCNGKDVADLNRQGCRRPVQICSQPTFFYMGDVQDCQRVFESICHHPLVDINAVITNRTSNVKDHNERRPIRRIHANRTSDVTNKNV